MSETEKLQLFHETVRFLRDAGACHMCATGMALATVEHRRGLRYDWHRPSPRCGGTHCEEIARKAWAERRAAVPAAA